MSRNDGDMVEVELGDGKGHLQVSGTGRIWCRTVDGGVLLELQWWSDEPVPQEGARVTAEWRQTMLHYPRFPARFKQPGEETVH